MKSTIKFFTLTILAFVITLTMTGIVYGTEEENVLEAPEVSNTLEENPLTTDDEPTDPETEPEPEENEEPTNQTLGAPMLLKSPSSSYYIGSDTVISGENYNRELEDTATLTYTLLSQDEAGYSSDEYVYGLPEGLTFSNGVISGSTSTETKTNHIMYFSVTDGENTQTGRFYIEVMPADSAANLNNIYTETGDLYNEGYESDTCYAQEGFLVYSDTELDYIKFNEDTNTYNIVLSQDIENDRTSNYIEIVFKKSEYSKLVKWEIIELEGMLISDGSLNPGDTYTDAVDYYYSNEAGDEIYSSYIYAEIDPEYEGKTRHALVKIYNPTDDSQFRYVLFTIINKDSLFVAFESNGGTPVPTIEAEVEEVVEEPEAPTKEGYVFAGWYDEEELITEHDFSAPVLESITLYAKWNEIIATEEIKPIVANSNPQTGDGLIIYVTLLITALTSLIIIGFKKSVCK